MNLVWEYLSLSNFETPNRLKAAYLKRLLGLHSSAKNRTAYLLANTPLFTEELLKQYKLPCTDAYSANIRDWEIKLTEIEADFLWTPAIENDRWKGANRTNRHLITRHAAHGFHHKLCRTAGHHEPIEDCLCAKCGALCERYHALKCPERVSLTLLDEQ